MGGSYFGSANWGKEKSAAVGSSPRKGKKCSNSEKPKQPQRGLGVAQLEKIRLNSQMGSSSYLHPSFHDPSYYPTYINQMSSGELERASTCRYGDSQPSTTLRWNPYNAMLETQQFAPPSMESHFQNLQIEDSLHKKRDKDQGYFIFSSSQNSDSTDTQELDLELRL